MKDKVSIHIRVRTKNGKHPFAKPVWSKGKLKPFYAVVDGVEELHREGIYYLRYRVGQDRTFEQIGQDIGLVLATKMRREAAILDGTLTKSVRKALTPEPAATKTVSTPTDGRHPLLESIRTYLTEKKAHRSNKTYLAYSSTWRSFLEYITLPEYKDELSYDACTLRADASEKLTPVVPAHLSIHDLEDITREQILNFVLYLRDEGSCERSRYNQTTHVVSLFHHYELKSPIRRGDKPTFTKKKVQGYSEDILNKMFAVATEDEADLLLFFLCVGLRAGEVEFACWPDLDLDSAIHTVTEHLDLGFKPKDREEGTIPLPPNLVDRLRARRRRYPKSRLIFPTPDGKPNRHLLRTIKRLGLRSGVNCGHCVNKKRQSCATHAVCKHIILHKLRKSFARMMHANGTPLRDVQAMLRHSDPLTTQGYIEHESAQALHRNSAAAFTRFGTNSISEEDIHEHRR